MIPARVVVAVGLSQLMSWGISFYAIGVVGGRIARELGWPMTLVQGGFSTALVVMGLASAPVGRLIDRCGGRRVMTAGAVLLAAGCAALSRTAEPAGYLAAWAVMGLAMRMTLYEAAFAALARAGGAAAARPIAGVTLLGGLASTVFWPLGQALAEALGWRDTLLVYAGVALLTVPLHAAIPDRRPDPALPGAAGPAPRARSRPERGLAAVLVATALTLVVFLATGLSAHLLGILGGLGAAPGVAVVLASLWGVGQVAARVCQVSLRAPLDPMTLGVVAASALPAACLAGLASGASIAAGAAFVLAYGAGNGLMTIVRGTWPLVLFDRSAYGAVAGWLSAPGFIAAASAPVAYALLIGAAGPAAALLVSALLGALVLACAVALRVRFP